MKDPELATTEDLTRALRCYTPAMKRTLADPTAPRALCACIRILAVLDPVDAANAADHLSGLMSEAADAALDAARLELLSDGPEVGRTS